MIIILVEGCLDKALAHWLANLAELRLVEPPLMYGGWSNVIRSAARFTLNPRFKHRVLAIIDADENIEQKIDGISRIIKRLIINSKTYIFLGQKVVNNFPLLIRYDFRNVSDYDTRRSFYVLFWSKLSNGIKGTVEDLLWDMLYEKYSCNPNLLNINICSSCPCRNFAKKFKKIGILAVLAACICKYTIVEAGERYCGIPVIEVLSKLDLENTRIAKMYINVLKSLIS